MNKENNRNISLDLLRILACIMVITIHTSAQYWYSIEPNTFEWQVFNIYDSISRSSVPIFVMISGACFLEINKKIEIKLIYKKYILKLLIAYIFSSIFYTLVFNIVAPNDTLDVLIKKVIDSYYHLWFIPMMIGIYILLPILKKVIEHDNRIVLYYIMVFFIFGIIKSTILLMCYRSSETINNLGYVDKIFNTFNIKLSLQYSGYFILGNYLINRKYDKKIVSRICGLGIIGVIFCVGVNSLYSIYNEEAIGIMYDSFSISTFIESIAIFILFKAKCEKLKFKANLQHRIIQISSCTFGIYLIHPYVLYRLSKLGLDTMKFNPIISVPLIVILTFIISYLAISLVKKMMLINKYII